MFVCKCIIKKLIQKPEISIDGIIDIKDGRHPVVELMLKDEVLYLMIHIRH